MTPRKKPQTWAPPATLRIEVFVQRGDLSLKADATPADAVNVAKMLTVMCRHVTKDAPDLLPHADTVPGEYLAVIDEDAYEAKRPEVGFTKRRR